MRVFRTLLYWLARLAGVVGLLAGGKSLGKYALARLKDPYFDSFSYNDLVFSGGVIFLLSLLVLIAVEMARSLERSIWTTSPGFGGSGAAKPVGNRGKPIESPADTAAEPAATGNVETESPDKKLVRLVKQKEG